jgi:hypothetical protein
LGPSGTPVDARWRRFGEWTGVAGPLAFLVLYTLAATGDPEYVFFDNYLSDLGVGSKAAFFNAAVIIAGGLTVPFALLGILQRPGKALHRDDPDRHRHRRHPVHLRVQPPDRDGGGAPHRGVGARDGVHVAKTWS